MNQGRFSVNWKPGWLVSKFAAIRIDRASVASVVQSAIQRALRFTASASRVVANWRRIRIAATPTSGAKVVRLRMPLISALPHRTQAKSA